VLHGALAVALPTRFGQKLEVNNARGSDLIWESIDSNGEVWFESQISLYDFSPVKTSDETISRKLKKIFRAAVRENSEFLSTWSGFKVETVLEFPRKWGLGSSSSLISLIAQWAEVNPFHLYFDVYNGSGYDVACAEANEPIHYRLGEENLHFQEIDFNPPFRDQLFFVYLGSKQDSEAAVKIHGKKFARQNDLIKRVSEISEEIVKVKAQSDFNRLLDEHESLIGRTLDLPTVRESRFSDFNGSVKSLGAWGGDFILASSSQGEEYINSYFRERKYEVILPFRKMVKSS